MTALHDPVIGLRAARDHHGRPSNEFLSGGVLVQFLPQRLIAYHDETPFLGVLCRGSEPCRLKDPLQKGFGNRFLAIASNALSGLNRSIDTMKASSFKRPPLAMVLIRSSRTRTMGPTPPLRGSHTGFELTFQFFAHGGRLLRGEILVVDRNPVVGTSYRNLTASICFPMGGGGIRGNHHTPCARSVLHHGRVRSSRRQDLEPAG
jgi:hypothetical protein